MSNFAKPINELLTAPVHAYNAMISFTEYYECARILKNDIHDRFDYPSLWAAINQLIEYVECRTKKLIELKSAGYTIDDAFTLHSYELNE